MRVHEIAKALGADSRQVRTQLARVGITTKSPSSWVEPIAARTFIAITVR